MSSFLGLKGFTTTKATLSRISFPRHLCKTLILLTFGVAAGGEPDQEIRFEKSSHFTIEGHSLVYIVQDRKPKTISAFCISVSVCLSKVEEETVSALT